MTNIYAEDINYFETSTKTSSDGWLFKTKKLILDAGGSILMEGFGSESASGRSAFILAFQLQGVKYKVIWPVLPSRHGKNLAAKIQAATMLYHDIKAKIMSAQVLGFQSAFFSYMLLPDGRTAVEASVPELLQGIPDLFKTPQLPEGEIIDGEIKER